MIAAIHAGSTHIRPKDLMPRIKAWFEEYVHRFDSHDATFQENINLKAEHTRRVCAVIRDIGGSLHLSQEDLCLAEASALLHDIGRFEQYRRHRTFADHRSENHADLGVKVIRDNHVLDGLEFAASKILIRAVGCHNNASLPEEEPECCLFFLKLLRDADKIDIWRVVTEYYGDSDNNRNRTIELDLPDIDHVSPQVFKALMDDRLVHISDLRTLQDFKLLQIGWIYDVNFPRTFQIVREKKYLEAIREALPQDSLCITKAFKRAYAHLERNAAAC
jgi:HD superfamily phosphodiesterase